MRWQLALAGVALLLAATPASAQVEKVRAGSPDAPGLPEDLFALPPGSWAFARQLWAGRDPCDADQCEAGYTSGDVVVSVERSKEYVRIVGGFRGCESVAWNELDVGKSPSKSDSKAIAGRLKRVLKTSAKYCKVTAPALPQLDAALLYPPKAEAK
jgi:hypothetical protein